MGNGLRSAVPRQTVLRKHEREYDSYCCDPCYGLCPVPYWYAPHYWRPGGDRDDEMDGGSQHWGKQNELQLQPIEFRSTGSWKLRLGRC